VRDPAQRVRDRFVGQSLCLAKISVRGTTLDRVLALSSVAEVELPPVPVLDSIQVGRATRRDFPAPPPPPTNGPRLWVIDSGITANHPFLAPYVGHEEAILTATNDPADQHGHGTMVAGIAVFGSVKHSFASGTFASNVTVFSARVLNDENQFDDERLFLTQMRQAIETFKRPPHNCRVFNLSLGTFSPALSVSVALAFDPPVRRRRHEYLGVEMTFQMFRGKTLDEVVRAYRKLDSGVDVEAAFKGSTVIKFKPPTTPRGAGLSRKKSTLQKGVWTFKRENKDFGDTYWLVVRADRRWAPDDVEAQDFGIAVTMRADEPQLYTLMRNRIRLRARDRG